MPTLFCEAEGHIMDDDKGEPFINPAQSETPGMLGNFMRENRETSLASGSIRPDRLEKAMSYETSANASEESDSAVVPAKRPNKGEQSLAEGVEGRALAKKNHRTSLHVPDSEPGKTCPKRLAGVRQATACRHYSRQEPYALKCARTDLCGGRPVTGVPTATMRR